MNTSREHSAAHGRLRVFTTLVAACLGMLVGATTVHAAPAVTIGGVPSMNKTSGTFNFSAVPPEPVLKYECSLDGSVFTECSSPISLSGLSVSAHTFRVRAIGLDSSIGAETTHTWTIDIIDPVLPTNLLPIDNLLTTDPTPSFSGKAEPFARVPVFDGSTQIGNPQADANGDWSFTPILPLADGLHMWTVRAIDQAGNMSAHTTARSLRIDTTAPASPSIAIPAENGKLNQRRPTFSGSAEAGATVSVMEASTLLCSAVANGSGGWSCASTSDVSDGAHALDASATDPAGNVSTSTVRNFTLDATPPPPPSIASPSTGLATAAASLVVSGSAGPLAEVKLFNDTTELGSVVAALDGSWSLALDPIDEADFVFIAKTVDDYDNLSADSNHVAVRIDRTAPVISFAVHPAAKSNSSTASFVLAADEPNVDFECALDVAPWSACSANVSFSGLSEGSHSLRVRGDDLAGNSAGQKTFGWSIDVTPPAVPVFSQPAPGAVLKTATPTFSGSAESGATVDVIVDNLVIGSVIAASPGGAWSFVPSTAVSQGLRQAKVRARDVAGNVSASTAPRSLLVDSIAPVTTVTGSTPSPSTNQQASITFTVDDPLATASCSVDTAAFVPCMSPFTSPALSDGTHTLRVRAVDANGNVESPAKSRTFVVDRTAPIVQSFLITGSAGTDGVPKFQIASNDSTAHGTCKIDNGAFSPCMGQYKPPGVGNGMHALTVRFTDVAGNSADQVIVFNVAPVTIPPQVHPENPYVPPATPSCDVLGVPGSTSLRASISSISGNKKALIVGLRSGTAAIVRLDLRSGSKKLASHSAAVKSGGSLLTIKLKRAIPAGAFELAARLYSVKREYGTVSQAGTSASSRYAKASGAQSVLDSACPKPEGGKPRPKFVLLAKTGAKSAKLSVRGKAPVLAAIKLRRVGSSAAIADAVLAVGPLPFVQTLSLASGEKFAAGSYRLSYVAIGTGGASRSGSQSLRVR